MLGSRPWHRDMFQQQDCLFGSWEEMITLDFSIYIESTCWWNYGGCTFLVGLGLIRYDKCGCRGWWQFQEARRIVQPCFCTMLTAEFRRKLIPKGLHIPCGSKRSRDPRNPTPQTYYMESRSSDLKSKSPPLDVASTVNAVFWCIYWTLEDTIGLWWSKLEFAHNPGSSFHRE